MQVAEVALDQLFRTARTHNAWRDKPIADDTLRAVYDLMKWGPTSANSTPAHIVFVKSSAAKARLEPALSPGNRSKTMAAPVTAIVAYDTRFYERLPFLFPQADARSWFEGNDALIQATAFRNASLQGAYLIVAARALGLDCGPMSGFDQVKLDAAFFADGRYRSNFLCNLGYGDPAALFPRNPRRPFEEACAIL